MSFEPKNMGIFNSVIELCILGSAYKYPIKVMGECQGIDNAIKATKK